jgi:hypothetical protein
MGVMNGLLLLARFRPEGFGGFLATPLAFLNSLAPLAALALVFAIRPLLSGSLRALALHVSTALIALLAPAAISHLLARLWDREGPWLRYSVAYNWCHAAVTMLTLPAVSGALAGASPALRNAMTLATTGLLLYWFALAWFLARRGLGISGGRAVLTVLAVHFGTGVLLLGPAMLAAGLP